MKLYWYYIFKVFCLQKDIDFQANIDVIDGHWTGFSDRQSGISYYRVGLGTKPYIDDIKAMVSVGLVEGMHTQVTLTMIVIMI